MRPYIMIVSGESAPTSISVVLKFANELPAGQPAYQAAVESLLFDGANSAVLLRETTTKLEFRIALPQTGRFADLRVGESILFSFDPDRAVCFPVSAAANG